jgi:hypothetical protein
VLLVLGGVIGVSTVGRGSDESAPPPRTHNAAHLAAKQLSPAAALGGASALARTTFAIPPPHWLVGLRPAVVTNRNDRLGWQADPYAE